MNQSTSIHILSTRALSAHAVQFAGKNGWSLEVVPLIGSNGILDAPRADFFMNAIIEDKAPFMLIFSSMNGVKWLKKGLDEAGQLLPPGITALCVGKQTAARAADQLKVVPLLIAPDGATLLSWIKKHIPKDTRLLYPCAKSRLDTLPEGLKEEGYRLVEIPVYETISTPGLLKGHYHFIMFFSPSAIDSFFSLNQWQEGSLGVCIGETTANALREKGVNRIIVAEEPSERAMVEAIHQFLSKD
ncbi:MAG: uroporphyrinogen-III synthase [Chitinophagaceae bacterium]|nr:uroporphyrinogen-III synthase [Chitinophagaceae bacterium]